MCVFCTITMQSLIMQITQIVTCTAVAIYMIINSFGNSRIKSNMFNTFPSDFLIFYPIQKHILKVHMVSHSSSGADHTKYPKNFRASLRIWKKNLIFWRKIVIFHTKYPKYFRASLRSAQFF